MFHLLHLFGFVLGVVEQAQKGVEDLMAVEKIAAQFPAPFGGLDNAIFFGIHIAQLFEAAHHLRSGGRAHPQG